MMDLNEKDLENLQRYLDNSMSPKEKLDFQQEISNSTQLQEFIEIYSNIDQFNEDGWVRAKHDLKDLKKASAKFTEPETLQFSEKIKTFQTEYLPQEPQKKPRSINYKFLAGMAASLLILLYVVFPKSESLTAVYEQHNSWSELPSMVTKGQTSQELILTVERTFQEKKYDSTIWASKLLLNKNQEASSATLLYLGVSQLEQNLFDEALTTFNKLSNSSSIDNHKGLWYTALVYLKQNKKPEAIKALQQIMADKNNYRYKEAKEIIGSIE